MEKKIKQLEEEICYLKKVLNDLKQQPREFHYHVHVDNSNPWEVLGQILPPEDDNPFGN